ncbi:hypothetical protein I4300191C4_03190 [Solibaculum mannosilyticum]|nr:hypothetical protein BN3661_01368 [Eubacteriaceae bacterium CHKCI005]
MKIFQFTYTGGPIPSVSEKQHAAFLNNIQKAILLSLESRGLLSRQQCVSCINQLEEHM